MKATIFKIAMPVMAFIMAGAGAVTTKASAGKSSVLTPGYIHVALPEKCRPSVECSVVPDEFCRVNGTTGAQVYAMDAIGDDCWEPLYRP